MVVACRPPRELQPLHLQEPQPLHLQELQPLHLQELPHRFVSVPRSCSWNGLASNHDYLPKIYVPELIDHAHGCMHVAAKFQHMFTHTCPHTQTAKNRRLSICRGMFSQKVHMHPCIYDSSSTLLTCTGTCLDTRCCHGSINGQCFHCNPCCSQI